MSKRAEDAALKAYPNVEQPVWDESYPKTLFVRYTERNAFVKGYEQAEKDLILTWKDIKIIVEIADKMVSEDPNEHPDWLETEEGYYNAILDAFNKIRK